jgi:hypothetical protein
MKATRKTDKLINEMTENGDERQASKDRKSLISIIDEPSSIPKLNRQSALGNSGRIQTGHVSSKPNIRLSDSFI